MLPVTFIRAEGIARVTRRPSFQLRTAKWELIIKWPQHPRICRRWREPHGSGANHLGNVGLNEKR